MPVLKQFLKLYTTISLPKLAALMDTDEAAVKDQLKVLEVSYNKSHWAQIAQPTAVHYTAC